MFLMPKRMRRAIRGRHQETQRKNEEYERRHSRWEPEENQQKSSRDEHGKGQNWTERSESQSGPERRNSEESFGTKDVRLGYANWNKQSVRSKRTSSRKFATPSAMDVPMPNFSGGRPSFTPSPFGGNNQGFVLYSGKRIVKARIPPSSSEAKNYSEPSNKEEDKASGEEPQKMKSLSEAGCSWYPMKQNWELESHLERTPIQADDGLVFSISDEEGESSDEEEKPAKTSEPSPEFIFLHGADANLFSATGKDDQSLDKEDVSGQSNLEQEEVKLEADDEWDNNLVEQGEVKK